MITREYAACEECGTVHVLRIGIGVEPVQAHQFACTHCGSEMNLRLEMGVGTTYGPNAIKAEPDDSATIINLHPSFVFGKDEIHSSDAFPSLDQGAKMFRALLAARARVGLPPTLDDFAPNEPPQARTTQEWDALRATWSLTRNGKTDFAAKRMKKFLDAYPYPDRPETLADWLFQFTTKITQPFFEHHFEQLFEQLQKAIENDDFPRFTEYYGGQLSADHGQRYFELMKAYLGQFTEFSQVHHAVAFGLPVDDTFRTGSANFDVTRMIYGNAFEAHASNVLVLALLNNLIAGRPFDAFEALTLDAYLKLDKAGRFNAFAANPGFAAICYEADNQLRNASHHGGMTFDRASGTIHYRAGKGGQGDVKTMSYARYLARCTTIFIEAMLLLRLELLIADKFKVRWPL